ncbi:MAG: class I SAM-dependent methyltransferase [Bacteroidetes bacterium]|nr:class I SAM-dependent methyltransferase [Bacteroidota bacterium]
MLEHNYCLICHSKDLKSLETYNKSFLCKCNSCGFVFSKKIPTTEELESYYQGYGINSYLSPITVKRYHELLDEFEPFRKTNKLLDVGCGIGFFLDEAKKRGWEIYGTELSDKAYTICAEKGIRIKKGLLDPTNYKPGMFDIITSFEVIEHINNPENELKNFNTILRDEGLVYITTPNFNSILRYHLKAKYNIISYPEHLSYYTPKTLTKAFKLSGFKKIKVETTGISLTRFKTSKGSSDQKIISSKSDDEKIRNKVEKQKHLQLAKKILNSILTVLGKGDSLKGWFIKK